MKSSLILNRLNFLISLKNPLGGGICTSDKAYKIYISATLKVNICNLEGGVAA